MLGREATPLILVLVTSGHVGLPNEPLTSFLTRMQLARRNVNQEEAIHRCRSVRSAFQKASGTLQPEVLVIYIAHLQSARSRTSIKGEA